MILFLLFLKHAGNEVKMLIVGNNCDVGENKRQVSYREGEEVRKS